jgi:uncharacterized protein (TIGR02646 family)
MHAVDRSLEPEFIGELRAIRSDWDSLHPTERQSIRAVLREDFAGCCAYCENQCDEINGEAGTHGTIDHFRPRSKFSYEWLTWLNIVFVCNRCNETKANQWPDPDHATGNAIDPTFAYVNPNADPNRRPAEQFFEFDLNVGVMMPSVVLNPSEWWIADKTIYDLDLNSDYQPVGDRLPYLRRERLDFVIQAISDPAAGFDANVNLMLEFMLPDKPFSSFVTAYVKDRFPLFERFFR